MEKKPPQPEKQPHPLIDALLAELRHRHGPAVRANDAALCRALNIQAPTLSKMRSGLLPVSDTMRVRVMRTFGWSMKRLDDLAPPAAPSEQA